MQDKQTFKQRLFRIHTSAGIIFSLLMYISVFFGIFAILLPYIQVWEKPSRHFNIIDHTKINYNHIVDEVLKDPNFPRNNVIITLPGVMQDPALKISHRFVEPILFNPIKEEKINYEGKQTHLAAFLNEMHYGKPLDFKNGELGKAFMFFGRVLFGLVAVGIMLISISGLLLIIYMKFKNNGKTPKSFFSKYHIKVFTYAFPIFLIITLSGAFMNIGLISANPMAMMLSSGEHKSIDAVVGPSLFPRAKPVKKLEQEVKMLPINELIQKAKKINPDIIFQYITLINWKDRSAQIEFKGYNPYRPFLNGGVFNKPKVILSGYDGSLIKSIKVMDRSWSVYVAEATFFLHFLFGVDIFTRLFIALIMLASAIAIAFGVMLYLEKKVKDFNNKVTFYHWMEKLCLAVIIGVIPATAALFIMQWTLPFGLKDRVLWQQGIFFNIWLFTLFWSFFRVNSFQALKELLALGGVFFILAPILHYISLKMSPIYLLSNGMSGIFGVDFGLFILGIILIYLARKLPKNRQSLKDIWKSKKEKSK